MAPIDYICVLDFEATCHEDKKVKFTQEIIEFPVVVIDVKEKKVHSVFQTYVKPDAKKLSPFCTQLTGITQDQVDAGVPIKTAIG